MDFKNDVSYNSFKDKEKESDNQMEPFDFNNDQELKLENSFDSKEDFELQDNQSHQNALSSNVDNELWSLDQNEDLVNNMIQKKLEEEMKMMKNEQDNQIKKRLRDQQEITDDDLLSMFSKEEIQQINKQRFAQQLSEQNNSFPSKKLKVLKPEDQTPQAVNINQSNQYPPKLNYAGKIADQLESRLNSLESLVAPLSKLKNNTSYMNQLQNIKSQLFAPPITQQPKFYQNAPLNNLPCKCPNCLNQKAESRTLQIQKLAGEPPNQAKKEHRQLAIQRLYQRMSSIEKLLLETKTEIVQIETRNSMKKTQASSQYFQHIKQQQMLQQDKNLREQDKNDDVDKNLSTTNS